jgi:hypothetical protein
MGVTRKIIIIEKFTRAVKQVRRHKRIIETLRLSCPVDKVKLWDSEIENWQADHTSMPDPYQDNDTCE